ncbi:hypothetical protein BH23VER1_BH23VER1_08690 [soil metagenome]
MGVASDRQKAAGGGATVKRISIQRFGFLLLLPIVSALVSNRIVYETWELEPHMYYMIGITELSMLF